MSPTSDVIAQVSLALSYPELFQVTGPLPSLVLRTEVMWWRHNQCHRSERTLLPHFRGLRDSVEYEFLDCIPHRHQ